MPTIVMLRVEKEARTSPVVTGVWKVDITVAKATPSPSCTPMRTTLINRYRAPHQRFSTIISSLRLVQFDHSRRHRRRLVRLLALQILTRPVLVRASYHPRHPLQQQPLLVAA